MLLYLKAFRREIERSLRHGTSLADLVVTERQTDGRHSLQLNDDHKLFLADNHGPAWALHPLPIQSNSDRHYLFGLKINFVGARGQDTLLASASMILAVRLGSSDIVPLVRAEWDSQGVAHAQPHWHVYPRPKEGEGAFGEISDTPDLHSLFFETGRIHWAMCANWFDHGHKSLAYEYDFEKIDSLANWLGGCVGYVKRQLEYVEKKMPAGRNFFEDSAAAQR